MSIKNKIIQFALQTLPIPHYFTEKPERILVVSTTALGDTLWATPALDSLRTSFPQAYIAVMTRPIGMEILKHNPSIDRLICFKNPLFLWKDLVSERFDTALIFHASQRLPLPLAKASGACRVVGTLGLNKNLDSLLTHPLPNEPQHEITRRLKMVEAIGGTVSSETLSFYLQEEEKKEFFLEKGSWVALHAGSKDSFKRWPLKYFAEVGKKLQETGRKILLTGTLEEEALLKELCLQIPGSQIAPLHLPLRRFASLLNQLDLLISNDTGPVHLASALNKPVIAIYSSTLPSLCGPHKAEKTRVISRPPTCYPCLKRRCQLPFCFQQITPDEVIFHANKLLG